MFLVLFLHIEILFSKSNTLLWPLQQFIVKTSGHSSNLPRQFCILIAPFKKFLCVINAHSSKREGLGFGVLLRAICYSSGSVCPCQSLLTMKSVLVASPWSSTPMHPKYGLNAFNIYIFLELAQSNFKVTYQRGLLCLLH